MQNAGGIDAVHHRHRQVENDEVGSQLLGLSYALTPIGSFSAHLKTIGGIEKIANRPSNGYRIVNHQDGFLHFTLPRERLRRSDEMAAPFGFCKKSGMSVLRTAYVGSRRRRACR